ncbi:MAG: T9SS type A sorting domain-containing protein [Emticicia sp.]|nr:T9SS type A sorting domain-containing protein [Emticicia sp.]
MLLFTVLSVEVLAQISVSFPTNRIVFQRNNDNIGFVNIIGNYSEEIDKVEAKLTPIVAGQGTETDWILVQEKPKAGYFAGKIQGQGGWYKLDVRAIRNNSTVKTVSIEKVGIGEVFIALGQSNAQGIPNYGAKGATDDRVNAINFQNSQVLDPLPENLNFVQLSENVNVAPQGDGPWCYGELGDRLVRRLNVPIAFFNEGLLLVSVINWRESAEGKPTFNFVLDIGGRFQLPNGLPYVNLKNTLQYYGALMGVRSLLWIQGETDNSPNRLSADAYSTNLQRVIDISRNDFDENLTWMVARTSVTYLAPSNAEIIGGQNQVINAAGNNVFAGPFTDSLQIPRLDDVHFRNVPGNMGISLLAENWDKSLDDNFFKNSKPILAKSIIEPEINCDTNNQVSLKLPEGLKSYEWSNNAKTSQITVNKGTFTVAVKDLKGNKLLVPSINTNLVYPSSKPVITADKSLEFCTDGTAKIELTANISGAKAYIWSSGESTQKISVDKSGDFTVEFKNDFGCISEVSEKVSVKANPTPAQPKIVIAPASNVCAGDKITLSVESNDKILWSNTTTSKTISLDTVGNYDFSVRTINDLGCESIVSPVELLSINSTPKQPTLSQIGLFTLNVSSVDFISNDQFEWKKDNVLFTKTTAQNLKISQDGNYQVSTIRTYKTPNNQTINCSSPASNILIFQASNRIVSVYPNPASDLIYLDTKENIKNVEVKIYTLTGKQVFKFRADDTAERKEIDIKNLEKGSYMINIKADGFEDSSRLIIQK